MAVGEDGNRSKRRLQPLFFILNILRIAWGWFIKIKNHYGNCHDY